jgi:hypothetical protein
MLHKRIENLEAALNDPQSRGELSIDTRREVLRIVREDEAAVDMLRQAALLEDTMKDIAGADELRSKANARMRVAIAQQLGEAVAQRIFEEN